MFTNTYIAIELARERQRDMQAQAGQQRLVRQLCAPARPSSAAERVWRRLTRSVKRSRPAALPS